MTENTIKILATMTAFTGSELVWTNRILADLSRMESQETNSAVTKLQLCGYLARHQGSYILTDDGREYYAGLCKQPTVSESIQAWKNEVLTGMDHKGRRSVIQHAVLPGSPTREAEHTSLETLLTRAKTKQMMMSQLGIDAQEYDRRICDGSLHLCRGWDGVPHQGIFHRRSKNNGWQYLCRDCRKTLRKRGNDERKKQDRMD